MKKSICLILISSFLIACTMPVFSHQENLSGIDINWNTYFEGVDIKLSDYENIHPRIWLDNSDFSRIRGYAGDECSALWSLIEKTADEYVKNGVQEFRENEENVWMNTQGKNLVALIFAYKISAKDGYLNSIFSYIDKICEYPSWSNKANDDNCHLAGNSNFLAFGIAYDWLYNELGEERKVRMVENIKSRIEDYNYDSSYGFDSINLHNSIVINTSALVALSAMYEEIPKAEEYMKRIAAKIATLTMPVMPDDGAAFEAVNYSSYTWTGLMQAGMVMKELLNVDILNHPTFDAYAKFSCYSYLPVNGWKTEGDDIFGWADGTEDSNGNLLPVMSYMAREKQNSVYKYFVEKRIAYAVARNEQSYALIYPLMFYDETLVSESPADDNNFSTSFITEDTGYAFLKNDWSGNEASIHFHCGPILGNTAKEFRRIYKGSTLGVGHNHPDMGSPLIFAEGEWLFDDDNYVTGVTTNHNALTVNGIGQVSDSQIRRVETDYGYTSWQAMIYSEPKIVKSEETEDIVYVVCDLTDIYPDEHYIGADTKLNSYLRHFVYYKSKKALFVIDKIKADESSSFELRWHPTSQEFTTEEDGSYLYSGKYSKMRLEAFDNENIEIENSLESKVSDKNGNYKDAYVLKLTKKGTDWIQATAISWENNTLGIPLNTNYTESNGICEFELNEMTISVDTNKNEFLVDKEVYFYNDFSDSDVTDKLESVGTVTGEYDVENGVFKLSKGTFKLNNSSETGKNAYVSVPYINGRKPNLVLEYKITPHDLKGGNYNSTNRFLYTNTHSIDAVFFGGAVVDADSTVENTATDDIALLKGTTNENSYVVKIIYSATENIRTIYINGVCYGTFDNKATDKAWSADTTGKFHFAFSKNNQASSLKPMEIDYVKVYKQEEKMIDASLSFDGISLPTGTKNRLWVPENEKVNLKILGVDGKTFSVAVNSETYIDSFKNDFTYITPELKEKDEIIISLNDIENTVYSYTSPWVYQYERENGEKSSVVIGRINENEKYKPYSYGVYFSLYDTNVTPGRNDVGSVDVKGSSKIKDGTYAIDIHSPYLKTGDTVYYKAFLYYVDSDEDDMETAEKEMSFGEVRSFIIE